MKKLLFLFALVTVACFSGYGQTGPSYDNAATIIGLISSSGFGPFLPLTTTGSSGPSYDNAGTVLLLGYNSTTKKYYVCGAANPCTGGGGGGGGGATIASTSNVIKGDGAGNGVAATPGTDYATPAQVIASQAKTISPKRDYGAVGDTQSANDCTVTTTTALTCASSHFVVGDVGKKIGIPYAGTLGTTVGNTLVSTIAAYVSPTQVTLADTPVSAISGPVTLTCSQAANASFVACPTGAFVNSDIGKGPFIIAGAGPVGSGNSNNSVWIRNISAATTLTVTRPAITTVSSISVALPGAKIYWGTDDTSKMQSAVTAGCATKTAVVLDPGNYLITSTIVPCSNLTLLGYGSGVSVLSGIGTGFGIIYYAGTPSAPLTNTTFRGFEIDAGGVRNGAYSVPTKGLQVAPTINSWVDSVYCHDSSATCIAFDQGVHSYITNNTVLHGGAQAVEPTSAGGGGACIGDADGVVAEMDQTISGNNVSDCGNHGIFVETQTNNFLSTGIRILGNSCAWNVSTLLPCISVNGGDGALMANNTVRYSPFCMGVDIGLASSYPQNWVVTNNVTQYCGQHFTAKWQNGTGTFKGNTSYGTFNAGGATPAMAFSAITGGTIGTLDISGNTLHDFIGPGMSLLAGTFNIVTEMGNVVYNMGSTTGTKYPGLQAVASANRLILANNVAFDSRGTQGQSYGFSQTAGTITTLDNFGNDFAQNITGPFNFAGTVTNTGGTTIEAADLLIPTGTVPTMAPNAAAGTAPTCTSTSGHNQSMILNCTTGTATTTGTLATITFGGTLPAAPTACSLTARNAITAPAATSVFTTAPTTTTFTIGVATALTASTAYSWIATCF